MTCFKALLFKSFTLYSHLKKWTCCHWNPAIISFCWRINYGCYLLASKIQESLFKVTKYNYREWVPQFICSLQSFTKSLIPRFLYKQIKYYLTNQRKIQSISLILGIGKLCTVCTPKEGSEARHPYWQHHRGFDSGWRGDFGTSANQLSTSFSRASTPPTASAMGSSNRPETDLDQFYPGSAECWIQQWDSRIQFQ